MNQYIFEIILPIGTYEWWKTLPEWVNREKNEYGFFRFVKLYSFNTVVKITQDENREDKFEFKMYNFD